MGATKFLLGKALLFRSTCLPVSLLWLFAALVGACSFDASKLRASGSPNLDGAIELPATSDATWAGSGGATIPSDTGMGGSGGGAGQADGGDSSPDDGTEVPLVVADGGLDVFLSDSIVAEDSADGVAQQDVVVQPDAESQPDVFVSADTTVLPDLASQPDVAVPEDLAPDADSVTNPDAAAQETAGKDTTAADAHGPNFCDPADPDLVACYRFEGNIADESSYGNHGSATNVSYLTGVAGQAVRTSSNSDIAVPASASLNPAAAVTIELWAQPQTTLARGRAGLVDNDGEYGIFVYPGNSVTCTVGAGAVSAPSALPTTGWTHIACVYDGANLRLYRNGVLVGNVAQTGRIVTSGPAGLSIGHNNPTGDPFDGAIDGLRIWRVARPAEHLCFQPADCG